METKFDFEENPNNQIKDNASGLFRGVNVLFKRFFSFGNEVDKNLVVNSIKADISMQGTTAWILVCSILIASVGLNANSTPVVIGAMLISPLMGPILGIGYSISTNDFQCFKKSISNFLGMVLISVATAYVFFILFPLREESSELLARTKPDIRDVLIAFFGGLALIIAKTKKENLSSAIFGVAIATALMPPLCTAGFGLAIQNTGYATGAIYLFLINSIYIIIATYLVLKFLRFPLVNYTNQKSRKKINRYVSFISLLILIPATITFYNVLKESKFNLQAKEFLTNELKGRDNYDYLIKNASYDYNNGNSKIIINNYGQMKFQEAKIEILKLNKSNYTALKQTKLIIQQDDLSDSNRNSDGIKAVENMSEELVIKQKKITELEEENQRLQDEIGIINSSKIDLTKIADEAFSFFEALVEFDISEGIKRDGNRSKKYFSVKVKWDSRILVPISENTQMRNFLDKRLGEGNYSFD